MAPRRVLVTGMSGLIGGVLRRHLDGTYELSALNRAYNQAIESIQHIVQEIKSGAVVLRSASSDIAAIAGRAAVKDALALQPAD